MALARLVAFAVTLSVLGAVGVAGAEVTAPDVCSASRGALSFVGCSLASQLALPPGSVSVEVVALTSDRDLPAPDALRARVRDAVAIALGEQTAAGSERKRLRVELRLEKRAGALRVSADLRRALGFWQRVRHAKPGSEKQAFVEVPLDAELRALIPPPPLVVTDVLKLKAPERGIVALACGPLGSDGAQELALISRSSVRVGRIVGKAFAERKRVAWSSLSPVAAAPLREAIGTAEIAGDGTLRVGLSDRRDGLVLSGELSVQARFEGLLPVAQGSCVERSGVGMAARYQGCNGVTTAPGRTEPATLDAVAGGAGMLLGRELGSGRLLSGRGEPLAVTGRVGAQLALSDADDDGEAELAYSNDTLDPAADRVTLVTLQGGKARRRFEVTAPAVSAVTWCRREGPGMAPLLIATGDELWLVR